MRRVPQAQAEMQQVRGCMSTLLTASDSDQVVAVFYVHAPWLRCHLSHGHYDGWQVRTCVTVQ